MTVRFEINFIVEMDKDVAKGTFNDSDVEANFFKITPDKGSNIQVKDGKNSGTMSIGSSTDDDVRVQKVWNTMVPKEKVTDPLNGVSSGDAPNAQDLNDLNKNGLGKKPAFPKSQNKVEYKVGNKAKALAPKDVLTGTK